MTRASELREIKANRDLIIDYEEGMEIKPPCIIRGMSVEVCFNHSIEGLSNSGLKMLLDCPARYYITNIFHGI